jgi:Flp pilus assembly pilin Flp
VILAGNSDDFMERNSQRYGRLRQLYRRVSGGQSMTEYTLILAAIALAVFVAYAAVGQGIVNLTSWPLISRDLLGP